MALTKNRIKHIQSLKDKKHRIEHKTFVAEGDKMVAELIGKIKCQLLLVTDDFILGKDLSSVEEVIVVDNSDLAKASFLKTPQNVLGVFYQPENEINPEELKSTLSMALDGVQDPGNMGTIVRLCDWYGIENIFCSKDCADIYNPKTVQATMGAISRVKIHYLDLEYFLSEYATDIPVYGTLLDGNNMYTESLSENGIIIMGNEGNGIRPEIQRMITHKLFIPNYPATRETSESLNVAIATAIICAEFRRRS
ncbi:RNA methyltransferase [Dysgonomonas sp. 216]|uniref:RNA methyltransferase n=1 Tax=Dysgonomonas sp. 216 TaxID=2302934 RepID=UPI0013D6D37A|nr:RNA methyltransferase [Dysgonomonas sp. 216]NDW18582.1 RNA methyltransferase [Dysgonomonas sp. 216]